VNFSPGVGARWRGGEKTRPAAAPAVEKDRERKKRGGEKNRLPVTFLQERIEREKKRGGASLHCCTQKEGKGEEKRGRE